MTEEAGPLYRRVQERFLDRYRRWRQRRLAGVSNGGGEALIWIFDSEATDQLTP
ncbi:MAG: hypothetical protein ACR2QF_01225 [Geminicoccaceae bacterium]